MKLVKPLQLRKVTTVTLQMPSNSVTPSSKTTDQRLQVRQKLELQPCEEVRLYGAVSKKGLETARIYNYELSLQTGVPLHV